MRREGCIAVEQIEISIVVPVKDEAESVAALAAEISRALTATSWSWECLWVNDGSRDGTADVLRGVVRQCAQHRLVDLDGNFGQSAALSVGFAQARGRILATLDGDGQNDPADLPLLIRQVLDEGVDMVNGIRAKRRDNWVRRVSSRIANGFRNWLTGERVTDVGCAIRAFRRECILRLPVFKGMHRFLPTLVRMQGYTIAERPVRHRPRTRGRTKYGINNRLWVGLADTVAVCWMQRRLAWPRVRSLEPAAEVSRLNGGQGVDGGDRR
jgi:glycosyltransferase involved in cell wall biosynthesis